MYFKPYTECPEPEAIRVRDFPDGAYQSVGGAKGVGVLATVTGKIVVRTAAVSVQERGGSRKQTVFSVKVVSDLRLAHLRDK
jgi:hypothetical protein